MPNVSSHRNFKDFILESDDAQLHLIQVRSLGGR